VGSERFRKDGVKRRRRSRRETGAVSRQGWHSAVVTNFKRERELKRARVEWKEATA
jgi:hypothetical protein